MLQKKDATKRLNGEFRPQRAFVLGFLALIIIGALLLSMPAMTQSGRSIGFFRALFTSTSAVCVTGLVAVDTGTTFNLLGQSVLLLLIQLGGLGFVLFTTIGLILLGSRLSLKGRLLMREATNSDSFSGVGSLVRRYTLLALLIETCGAVLLSVRFIPRYGWGRGLWFSFFHAISAFCNAGFDLFGNFSSLTGFWNDPYILSVVSLMIILGGIGFPLIIECVRKRFHWKELSLQARIVLIISAVLTAAGWLIFALLEWNNPKTLAVDGSNFGTKLLNSFFQSVTMRTAGFNSVDMQAMADGSKVFASVLMFIGASPASTGGGIKTTTMFLVFIAVRDQVLGASEHNILKKSVSDTLVKRAVTIFLISLMALVTCTVVLSIAEQSKVSLADILFETASAVATVGVSAAGTPSLHFISRIMLIPIMFIGRVGGLTVSMALAHRQTKSKSKVRYPEENIMIG